MGYYQCSFDIKLDSSFSKHFIYDHVEDGILHVECGGSADGGLGVIFKFGTTDTIAVPGHLKTGNSGFSAKGEWRIAGYQYYEYVWDDEEYEEDENNGSYVIYKNRKVVELNPRIGSQRHPELSIDMIEDEDGLTIQMYLFDSNDTTLAGVVKPLSTVAQYIPSSFKEFRGVWEDGTLVKRSWDFFKSNGEYANAVAGTEEAEELEQERQELLDSLVDYTPTEVITYDKSELEEPEEPPRNVTDTDKVSDTENEPEQDTTDAANTSTDDWQGATEDTQEPEPEPEPEPDRAEALQ